MSSNPLSDHRPPKKAKINAEGGILQRLFLQYIDTQLITAQAKEMQQFHSFVFFYILLSGFIFFCQRWAQDGHNPWSLLDSPGGALQE